MTELTLLANTIAELQAKVAKLESQQVVRTVELLRPEPGDVLLVKMAGTPTVQMRRQVTDIFQRIFKDQGVKCGVAVMPESMSVRVVRAAESQESEIKGPGFEHLNNVQKRPTELTMP